MFKKREVRRIPMTPYQYEICKNFSLYMILKKILIINLEQIQVDDNIEFYINTFTDKKEILNYEERVLFCNLSLITFEDFNNYYHNNKSLLLGLQNKKEIRNLQY